MSDYHLDIDGIYSMPYFTQTSARAAERTERTSAGACNLSTAAKSFANGIHKGNEKP